MESLRETFFGLAATSGCGYGRGGEGRGGEGRGGGEWGKEKGSSGNGERGEEKREKKRWRVEGMRERMYPEHLSNVTN